MSDMTRRDLLKASLPVLASVSIVGTSIGCGGATLPSAAVVHGPLDALAAGPTRMQGYDVFLLRSDEGIAAMSGRCTHAGCGVTPTAEGFHCGCHGSDFTEDGTVTQGPATTDLPWFTVRIEDGQVVVDPTQEVPKGTYTAV